MTFEAARVSFGEQDFDGEHVVRLSTSDTHIQAVIELAAVDQVPSTGEWCIISYNGTVIANGEIEKIVTDHITTVGETLGLNVHRGTVIDAGP